MVKALAKQDQGINKSNNKNHNHPLEFWKPNPNCSNKVCQLIFKIKIIVMTIKAIDKSKAVTIIMTFLFEKKLLFVACSKLVLLSIVEELDTSTL